MSCLIIRVKETFWCCSENKNRNQQIIGPSSCRPDVNKDSAWWLAILIHSGREHWLASSHPFHTKIPGKKAEQNNEVEFKTKLMFGVHHFTFFLTEIFKRHLVGYSPWSLKESDTAEQLSTHAYTCGHQLGRRCQALEPEAWGPPPQGAC